MAASLLLVHASTTCHGRFKFLKREGEKGRGYDGAKGEESSAAGRIQKRKRVGKRAKVFTGKDGGSKVFESQGN